jgi:hypothetical protein
MNKKIIILSSVLIAVTAMSLTINRPFKSSFLEENSTGTMNNTKSSKRRCNACSNTFDGVGYHYHYDSSGCKAYKGGTFSNGDGKYCSLKCAENACHNEH